MSVYEKNLEKNKANFVPLTPYSPKSVSILLCLSYWAWSQSEVNKKFKFLPSRLFNIKNVSGTEYIQLNRFLNKLLYLIRLISSLFFINIT